jgi:hypothetical protein
VPEGARGRVWCGRVSFETQCQAKRERTKGTKNTGTENSKGTKSGGFLGAQQAAGDERKDGALGGRVRALEAH